MAGSIFIPEDICFCCENLYVIQSGIETSVEFDRVAWCAAGLETKALSVNPELTTQITKRFLSILSLKSCACVCACVLLWGRWSRSLYVAWSGRLPACWERQPADRDFASHCRQPPPAGHYRREPRGCGWFDICMHESTSDGESAPWITSRIIHVCLCPWVVVVHMLGGFFKQHQAHHSMQLIIMLQSLNKHLLEFLPVRCLRNKQACSVHRFCRSFQILESF